MGTDVGTAVLVPVETAVIPTVWAEARGAWDAWRSSNATKKVRRQALEDRPPMMALGTLERRPLPPLIFSLFFSNVFESCFCFAFCK